MHTIPVTCVFLTVQGTLDVGLIDSVCASDNPDRWVQQPDHCLDQKLSNVFFSLGFGFV